MINTPRGRASLPKALSAIGHHLVFAEGTKTELNYAKSIEKSILSKYLIDPSVNHVEIIEVDEKKHGLDTVRLLDYAQREVERRLAQDEKIDYVWIFFDKDDFSSADFAKAIERIEKQNQSGYSEQNLNEDPCDKEGIHWTACYSNRCFELWLCLYFCFFQSQVSKSEEYVDKLNHYLKDNQAPFVYEKNLADLHQKLQQAHGDIDQAIRYGKKLREKNGTHEPSTNVDVFAFYFKNYLKK